MLQVYKNTVKKGITIIQPQYLRVVQDKSKVTNFEEAINRIKYLEKTVRYKADMNYVLCDEIAVLKDKINKYEQRICMLMTYLDDLGIKIY